MKICQHCNQPLLFTRRGWLHPGGGLYIKHCKACDQEYDGPTVAACPSCGEKEQFVDHHCSLPVDE
jgi:hypothetical protein